MRVLILNYTGDYREAFQRLSSGGPETYYAQKYSVEVYANLAKQAEEVANLVCFNKEPHNEMLPNGVRSIGCGWSSYNKIDTQKLLGIIEEYHPTHLILGFRFDVVLKWALKNKIPTLIALSSTVYSTSVTGKLKNRIILARLMNNDYVQWVGSYGLNSCLYLQKLGVKAKKIIPWDFLIDTSPGNLPPKSLRVGDSEKVLIYVGTISESKGVGDLLRAVSLLRKRGFSLRLKVVGPDNEDFAKNMAENLDLSDSVELLGLVPNASIEPLMREADVVVVPSRHAYTEGFPLTIHHALRSRTPLIASDHPMFKNYLQHQKNSLIFSSGDPFDLSINIEKLFANPELYWEISKATYDAWLNLRLPVKFGDLLSHWIRSQSDDAIEDKQWLSNHSLTSKIYSGV